MPLSLRRGTVTAIHERHDGLVRLEVDGAACVAYPPLTGPVGLGDDVLVNVQARELGLGSGGFDVLHANLTRGLDLPPDDGAHVMKLPYTPVQAAVRHAEEDEPLAATLAGMPVVCCSVHSQVAPVCAALAGRRVAYVQLEGGALAVDLSDTIRTLKERGLVGATVASGACFGGDAACVNVWSALGWAKGAGYEVAVCSIGPGIVGTGSRLGHGGLAAAAAANAANGLGGRPILAVRVSEADPRDRHRGLSHHAQAVIDVAVGELTVAPPEYAAGWRQVCDGLELPLSHMGRGPDEDAAFFASAFAAGVLAARLLESAGGSEG